MTSLKKKNNNRNLLKAISFLRLDLTLDELGEKLGYKKATISKYLSTKNPLPPSDEFLNKFEEVFNVKLSDFETNQPEIKNPQQSESLSFNDHYENLIKRYISLVDRLEKELDFERSKNNKI